MLVTDQTFFHYFPLSIQSIDQIKQGDGNDQTLREIAAPVSLLWSRWKDAGFSKLCHETDPLLITR